jgi:parallel beta-helix repeat protein
MIGRFGFLRRGALLSVLACLAAVGLVIPSVAAAKVTSVTSCQLITAPGKYRLDADLSAGSGATCIFIFANNVTFILNGHTISGFGGTGIAVGGSAANARIVGPGTFSGLAVGLILAGGGGSSVRGVTATGNPSGLGILLASSGNDVRGNVATDNRIGIAVTNVGASNNKIIGNFAHGNSTVDLIDTNPNCDSNVWRGNDFGTSDPAQPSCIH